MYACLLPRTFLRTYRGSSFWNIPVLHALGRRFLARWRAAVVAVCCVAAAACGSESHSSCSAASDCGLGEQCVAGACLPSAQSDSGVPADGGAEPDSSGEDTSPPDASQDTRDGQAEPQCSASAPCPAAQICSEGECADAPVCVGYEDCIDPWLCAEGLCSPIGKGVCEGAADCAPAPICDHAWGTCVLPVECEADADCESGESCDRGACSEPPTCDSSAQCDCGRECSGGYCDTPAGLLPAGAQNDDEYGDSPSEAEPHALAAGSVEQLSGRLQSDGDEDWLRLVVPANSALQARVDWLDSCRAEAIELWEDSAAVLVDRNARRAATQAVAAPARPTARNIYVRIWSPTRARAAYTLHLYATQQPWCPPDAGDRAPAGDDTPLPLDTLHIQRNVERLGRACQADEDWRRLVLAEPGRMQLVTVSPAGQSLRSELRDSSLVPIGAPQSGPRYRAVYTNDLAPGPYWIRHAAFADEAASSYGTSVRVLPSTDECPPDPTEVDDHPLAAKAFVPGTQRLVCRGDIDWLYGTASGKWLRVERVGEAAEDFATRLEIRIYADDGARHETGSAALSPGLGAIQRSWADFGLAEGAAFWLSLERESADAPGPLAVTLSTDAMPVPCEDDPEEPNDTWSDSSALVAVGSAAVSARICPDNEDWFTTAGTASDQLSVDVWPILDSETPSPESTLGISIRRSGNPTWAGAPNWIQGGYHWSGQAPAPQSGDWAVITSTHIASGVDYRIRAARSLAKPCADEDLAEPNDTPLAATPWDGSLFEGTLCPKNPDCLELAPPSAAWEGVEFDVSTESVYTWYVVDALGDTLVESAAIGDSYLSTADLWSEGEPRAICFASLHGDTYKLSAISSPP